MDLSLIVAIIGIIIVNVIVFVYWLSIRSTVKTRQESIGRRVITPTNEEGDRMLALTVSVGSIVKYSLLVVAIAGLWFLPNVVHIRGEYRPYDETITIGWSSKNYVERVWLENSWEADRRLTGKLQSTGPTIFYVFDEENYLGYINGGSYETLYNSGITYSLIFNVELPYREQYYMIFQNPSTQAVQVTYDAGIIFERAFQGISYMEWITRTSIFVLIAITIISRIVLNKR
jgi:hypothetical protein